MAEATRSEWGTAIGHGHQWRRAEVGKNWWERAKEGEGRQDATVAVSERVTAP